MLPENPSPCTANQKSLLRYLPLVLLLAVMAAIYLSGLHRKLSLEAVVAHRRELAAFVAANQIVALLGFAGVYAAAVALSIPGGVLLTLASGFLFGTLLGGTAAVLGATLGSLVVYLIARSALGAGLVDRLGPRLGRIAAGFRRDAVSYMLFLRVVPLFPFWLVNIAGAVFNVPIMTYAWTTLTGIIPATLAFAGIGAGLDSVLAAQIAAFDACRAAGTADCKLAISLKSLVTPQMLMALTGLAALALGTIALRQRWNARTDRAN